MYKRQVPTYDLEQMAARIEELIDNLELRIRFSAYTKENLNKFQKEKIYEQWKDLIEGITK